MKKSELREELLKDYLYEEYFIRKFKDFLEKRQEPEVKNTLSVILDEAKGHSAMLKALMARLKIDIDMQTVNSSVWLLQSLIIKKSGSKSLKEFLNDVLVEEVDLRKIYENQLRNISDEQVSATLNKIIKEEHTHEAKITELLAKS